MSADAVSDAQMGAHKKQWKAPGLHREYVMDDLRVPRAPYDQYRAKVAEGLVRRGMTHGEAEDAIYNGHDFGGVREDHYSGLSVGGSIENHLHSQSWSGAARRVRYIAAVHQGLEERFGVSPQRAQEIVTAGHDEGGVHNDYGRDLTVEQSISNHLLTIMRNGERL